jgi:opacity protein-like surface antigen
MLNKPILNKLLVATTFLVAGSNVALAASSAPYLGASAGISNATQSGASYRGIPMTVFAGYGMALNQNVHLAGEVFGTFGTIALNNNTALGVGLKNNYGYGASVIPGIFLSDHTIAFVRAGIINTHFSSLAATKLGAQFGLGLQTGITQDWDMRGEYTYTQYNHSLKSDLASVGFVYKID